MLWRFYELLNIVITYNSCKFKKSKNYNANRLPNRKVFYFCTRFTGEMAEWSIAPVLKTGIPRGIGGSNPSLSAKQKRPVRGIFVFGTDQAKFKQRINFIQNKFHIAYTQIFRHCLPVGRHGSI
jgi:hypothetical protein